MFLSLGEPVLWRCQEAQEKDSRTNGPFAVTIERNNFQGGTHWVLLFCKLRTGYKQRGDVPGDPKGMFPVYLGARGHCVLLRLYTVSCVP